MTQPLGNCPGCGTDEPFEQIHPGQCPDVAGECPEWTCTACGAGVIMGTGVTIDAAVIGTSVTGRVGDVPAGLESAPLEPSVRAA
jgi:hypothetical protein